MDDVKCLIFVFANKFTVSFLSTEQNLHHFQWLFMFCSGPCLPRTIRSNEWIVFNVNTMWFGSLWQVYCHYKYSVSKQVWKLSPADQRSSADQECPFLADLVRFYSPKCKHGTTDICVPPQHHPLAFPLCPTWKFLSQISSHPYLPSPSDFPTALSSGMPSFVTRLFLMTMVGSLPTNPPTPSESSVPTTCSWSSAWAPVKAPSCRCGSLLTYGLRWGGLSPVLVSYLLPWLVHG